MLFSMAAQRYTGKALRDAQLTKVEHAARSTCSRIASVQYTNPKPTQNQNPTKGPQATRGGVGGRAGLILLTMTIWGVVNAGP